mgnify:CR=1 FL=1
MSHVEHEWAREQIAAHLAGGLPAEERARLEAHIAACAECRAGLIDRPAALARLRDKTLYPAAAG